MQHSKMAVRATRGIRVNNSALRRNTRRFADGPRPQEQRPGAPVIGSGSGNSGSGAGSAVTAGMAGGAAASMLVFFAWYQYSGIGRTAQTLSQVKSYVDSTTSKLKVELKEQTPDANEAIDTLRQTANKYVMFIPGGRQYVDQVFKDLDIIRNKHGEEVDKLVTDAYGELRDASKKGLNLETASETWNILSKYLQELSSLAVDAGQDILNNHPGLKNRVGGSFDQLKQFGDSLGPEAKKQVDETYQQIREVVKQGLTFDTINRIRDLAQDKVEALKKLRDQAWQQGYDQLKPILDKNPQMKQTVEQNLDTLKSGNVTEALDKVKQAVSSNDSSSLNEYIQSAKDKGEQLQSSGLSSWLSAVPGGSQILPQLQKLQSIAQSQGAEAEQIAKETVGDIKAVLEKRGKQVEELYQKAQK